MKYLQDGELPENKDDAKRLRMKAARYILYDDKLYRRSFSSPLLLCVDDEKAYYIMKEIHEGICRNHSGGQALANKALRQGYFWPTMKKDTMEFARKCDKCQRFATIPRMPPVPLTSMTSPWPFAVWGIDIIGTLPLARGGLKYAVVAVDYFTKWTKAEALSTISTKKMIEMFSLEANLMPQRSHAHKKIYI